MRFTVYCAVCFLLCLIAFCDEIEQDTVNCDDDGALFLEELDRNSNDSMRVIQMDCLTGVTSMSDVHLAVAKVCGKFTDIYKVKYVECCKMKISQNEATEMKQNDTNISEGNKTEKLSLSGDKASKERSGNDAANKEKENRRESNGKLTEVISGQREQKEEQEQETEKRHASSEGQGINGSIAFRKTGKFEPRAYLS